MGNTSSLTLNPYKAAIVSTIFPFPGVIMVTRVSTMHLKAIWLWLRDNLPIISWILFVSVRVDFKNFLRAGVL